MTDAQINELLNLFATKARAARKTECVREYQAYWRGYAEAFDEAADIIRARSA